MIKKLLITILILAPFSFSHAQTILFPSRGGTGIGSIYERPLGLEMNDPISLAASIIIVLWFFGLVYIASAVVKKDWSLIWMGLYILAPSGILFILSLI